MAKDHQFQRGVVAPFKLKGESNSQLSGQSFNRFREELVGRVRKEIVSIVPVEGKTWDATAKPRIGQIVREVFSEIFPNYGESDIYIEGSGRGLKELGKPPSKLFGSEGEYPDMAILRPVRIAIELDHSGTKKVPGSSFKMALSKTAFNVLSKDWDYCLLLYFNESTRRIQTGGLVEREITSRFEELFHTYYDIVQISRS